MRRLLIIAGFEGSILSFRGELINEFISMGIEVHCAAPNLVAGNEIFRQLTERGVVSHATPLVRSGVNPVQDLAYVSRLISIVREIRPFLVFSYTIKPVIYGSIVSLVFRVPSRVALITGLGYAFNNRTAWLVAMIARVLYYFALRAATTIFFQNRDDLALFVKRRIITARDRVKVVSGSGVNTEHFAYSAKKALRSLRFLMIARFLGAKGIREYAAAAKEVRKLRPDATFELAGWLDDGPDAISSAELAEWVGSGDLLLLGRLSDVRPALERCDVFVLPSYREGTPRTVLEAMSVGRAIITTDAPGCRETVIDGENGFLIASGSTSELTQAILRCLCSPEDVARMGVRSRLLALEKYDVHKVNEVMLIEMELKR